MHAGPLGTRGILRRVSPDGWALIAIAAAVLLANLPYLVGFVDPNPLGPRSGLISAMALGPIRGQPTLDPNNGFISQAVAHRAVLDLLHLRMPWWNPYEGLGAPLAGNFQAAALFPLTLLAALANGQIYQRVLLELIAGVATYLLLRRIELRRWPSAAAAIAFALNGTFAWFAHATINPLPFLPLLLLGIELAYAATVRGRRGGWWLVAVAGALSVYAGFPEVAYIDALLAVPWFGWRCGCIGWRPELGAFAAKAGAGAIAGALLTAPLLVATTDYFNHADLWLHATDYFGRLHLPQQAMPQLLLPYVYGPISGFVDPKLVMVVIWENVGGFLTTSLLFFGLLGLMTRGRRGLRLALLVWIALAFSRMYDTPHFLGDVLGVVPGMSKVAFFRYAFGSIELAVVVLAAVGLDGLARARAPTAVRRRLARWPAGAARWRWGWALAAALALAAVAVAATGAHPLANDLGPVFKRRPYYAGSVAWGLAAVVVGAAAALLRDARARILLASLVLAGDGAALFAVAELSAPRSVTVDTAPVAFLRSHLGHSRVFTLGPLAPNYGSYYGVASLNVVDVPVPKAFARFVSARLDPVVDPVALSGTYGGGRSPFAPSPAQELLAHLPAYAAAGVAYVLTPAGQRLPRLTLVFRSPSTWIYRLHGTAPYISSTGSRCSVSVLGWNAARVRCPAPATLVRLEIYFPGWGARVDGRSVPIHPRDGIFQAVRVPAGGHSVTFSYVPPNIGWGWLGLAAGAALLVSGAAGWPPWSFSAGWPPWPSSAGRRRRSSSAGWPPWSSSAGRRRRSS